MRLHIDLHTHFLIYIGTETSSHTLVAALYFLKKNPQTLDSALEVLTKNGFDQSVDCDQKYTLENLDELTYITYLVKEALRVDSPTIQSLKYIAYDDIEICGVKIPKGTKLQKLNTLLHYNDEIWQDPAKFIPERHDPDSKFFTRPGTSDKARPPNSHVSFSSGKRSCPGQIFAMLELRVVMTYLLTHIEYSIDQKYLENDGIGFGIVAGCPIEIKITDIKN